MPTVDRKQILVKPDKEYYYFDLSSFSFFVNRLLRQSVSKKDLPIESYDAILSTWHVPVRVTEIVTPRRTIKRTHYRIQRVDNTDFIVMQQSGYLMLEAFNKRPSLNVLSDCLWASRDNLKQAIKDEIKKRCNKTLSVIYSENILLNQ